MIIALSWDVLRNLCRECSACRFHYRTRRVLCLEHTLHSERVERAKALGVVR